MTSRISGWCTTPATGRFTASVRLLGYVDCLSRVPGDWYARFCGEGVIAILPPYPTGYAPTGQAQGCAPCSKHPLTCSVSLMYIAAALRRPYACVSTTNRTRGRRTHTPEEGTMLSEDVPRAPVTILL